MSKRAEQAALKVYPPKFVSNKRNAKRVQSEKVDTHAPTRAIFIKGYQQTEQDLALTVQDIEAIDQIMLDLANAYATGNFEYELGTDGFYQETLKRFNDYKLRKSNI